MSVGLLQTFFGDDADVIHEDGFRVLLLASLVSPLGASVVSPLLDTLTGTFAVGEARIGLLMAAFTAPSILAIPLVGMLSDRVGRKPVLTVGLLTFGLAGSAIALTTDFRVVLALRLLQGLGYCGIGPVLIASLGDLYTGDREATAQGLRFTTVGASLTVFPLLAGFLVVLAWQYPFYLFALAVPTALAVHLVFEEPSDTASSSGGGVRALAAVVRHPRVLVTLVGRTVPSFAWFAFLTYNSIVVVRLVGGTPGQAGLLVAITSLASSVGSTQVGRLTAAFETRVVPLVGTAVASSLGILGLAVAPTVGPSLVVAGLGSATLGVGFGVALTLYRSELTRLGPESVRGGLVSLGESVGRVGSTTAPILLGAAVAGLRPAVGFGAAVEAALGGVVVGTLVVGVGCAVLTGRLPAPRGGRAGTPVHPGADD